MKLRLTILALKILVCSHVHAQQVSFQTFLSEHEKVEKLDSASFGSPYEFIESESLYSEFLPPANDDCHSKQKYISWQKGSYIEFENFIAVALQRYCSDYQDGNSKWFMENDGFDYMLITYSRDGKMIDCKTLCHSGTAAYAIGIKASDDGRNLIVEQKTLDDCSLLVQYKNLVYTSCTRKYTLKSSGKIKESIVVAPHKETVDVLSSVKQFSFEQFKGYFHKQVNPAINHTLFTSAREDRELPFESCLFIIPDTLDHNSWPRDIRWIPCQYIEQKNLITFFIIKDCSTPKVGVLPYADYMILEFHKDGTFKGAKNIYHWQDDSIADETTKNNQITKTLKSLKSISLLSEIDSTSYYYYYSNYPLHDCEDNIIEFSYKNGEIVDGYFWGTSDEFRDAREGFYPGFFVLRLEQISNKKDSIVFTLDSRKTQYLSGPVNIRHHSSDEALKHGYHHWRQNDKFFQDSVRYCGTFQKGNLVLHKDKSNFPHIKDRLFVRISPDSLQKINFQCSFEEENREENTTY